MDTIKEPNRDSLIPLDELIQAIKSRLITRVFYGGLWRTIEPYRLGFLQNGNEALVCYQIGGYSKSSDKPAWKLYLVSRIEAIALTDQTFDTNQEGYTSLDLRFTKVTIQVK